jgi:hypothetical protein
MCMSATVQVIGCNTGSEAGAIIMDELALLTDARISVQSVLIVTDEGFPSCGEPYQE